MALSLGLRVRCRWRSSQRPRESLCILAAPDRRSIGVFDSGLGGLTVVRELRKRLPAESIVYLGDTARVPYGTRSAETVTRYAIGCARALLQHEVAIKALVVACGTVSSVALDALRVEFDLPVLGVIEPSAKAAVQAVKEAVKEGVIGVLGTPGTIASGAYPRAILALSTRVEVVGMAAPLFVPLVEEGWLEGEVPRLAARRYLEPLIAAGARVIILGCTHYPLLKTLIQQEAQSLAGSSVQVIDTGVAVAEEVAQFLLARAYTSPGRDKAAGSLKVLVTDAPGHFIAVASRFLGSPVEHVRQIDL